MKTSTTTSVYLILCASFLTYSFSIYLSPDAQPKGVDPDLAGKGKLVYQKYNCQACHQLYNLGGYLGPDLTDVYSADGKGEPYIRAMVQAGNLQMPSFNLSEEELTALVAFLKQIDGTGSSDLRRFRVSPSGMISNHGQ